MCSAAIRPYIKDLLFDAAVPFGPHIAIRMTLTTEPKTIQVLKMVRPSAFDEVDERGLSGPPLPTTWGEARDAGIAAVRDQPLTVDATQRELVEGLGVANEARSLGTHFLSGPERWKSLNLGSAALITRWWKLGVSLGEVKRPVFAGPPCWRPPLAAPERALYDPRASMPRRGSSKPCSV